MNGFQLIGRLTVSPELSSNASGTAWSNFSVAVDRPGASGDARRTTDFYRVTAFGRQAELLVEHCVKGQLVGVSGNLRTSRREIADKSYTFVELVADRIDYLTKPRATGSAGDDAVDSGFGSEPDFDDSHE